jgi:SAM-dependent methyltransferase
VTGEYEPRRYWEDTLAAGFDESGVAHPTLPLSFNRMLYRSLRASTASILRANRVDPQEVLDVGVGTGIWLDFWSERHVRRLAGVDLTEIAVNRARARYPEVELAQVDIGSESIPFTPFDLISAMNVLLHVVDPEAFTRSLRTLRVALREGGWLLAMEPVAVGGVRLKPGASAAVRTLDEWHTELRAADFEVVDLRPATCVLSNPVDARSQGRLNALNRLWFGAGRVVGRGERRGAVVGGALYVVDRICTRLAHAGPSSKLILARAGRNGRA